MRWARPREKLVRRRHQMGQWEDLSVSGAHMWGWEPTFDPPTPWFQGLYSAFFKMPRQILSRLSQPHEAMDFFWVSYRENFRIHLIILERALDRHTILWVWRYSLPDATSYELNAYRAHQPLWIKVNPGHTENPKGSLAPLSFSHVFLLKIKAAVLWRDYLTNCVVVA